MSPKSQFLDRLKGMQESYDSSQDQFDSTFGGAKVPAGNYVAQVQSAKLVESSTSQKLLVRREHVIAEGEHKGTILYDNLNIETDKGFMYFRRWCDLMGKEPPEKVTEIEDLIEEISNENAMVRISLRHSGDFVNIGIIEVIEEGTSGGGEKPETTTTKSGDELDGLTKAKLKRIIIDEDLGISMKDKEPEDIAEEIRQARAEKGGGGKDTGKGKEAEQLEMLVAFCKEMQVELKDGDDDLEIVVEQMKPYDFPEKEMSKEEVELLEEVGLGDMIKRASKPRSASRK